MIPRLTRSFEAGEFRWPIVLTLIALSWLAPRTALAQQVPGLTLRWEAPARCPQQDEVVERVQKLSGSPSSVQGALQADGTITQADDGRFYLKLVLRSGGLVGERSIDARSCADLTRAAAVAIALLLHSEDPLGALSGEHPSSGAQDGAEPANGHEVPVKPAATEPKKTSQLAPARDRGDVATEPRREHLRLRAPLAALSVGPLPRPDWGVSLAMGASYRSWRLWLEGAEWLRQSVPSTDYPGYSANIRRATASLTGCRTISFSVFEVAPCLVLSLEHASAAGAGRNVLPQSQQVNWFAAGVGVQGRVYLTSWLALVLSVNGIIELSRPRFSIVGVGLVRQASPAAMTAMLGPEWIL